MDWGGLDLLLVDTPPGKYSAVRLNGLEVYLHVALQAKMEWMIENDTLKSFDWSSIN